MSNYIKTRIGYLDMSNQSDWIDIYQEYVNGSSIKELDIKYNTRKPSLKKIFLSVGLVLLSKEEAKQIKIKKARNTFIKNYGVDCPLKDNEIKNKIKQTNLEKYGVENVSQSNEIKNKIKQTNLEKYGVEYTTQSKTVKNKIKQTNLEKYGVEQSLSSREIREKIKQTNLKKYGYECVLSSFEIKNKIKQTNLEKYKVKTPLESIKIRSLINENKKIKYSKNLNNLLKNKNCTLLKEYTYLTNRDDDNKHISWVDYSMECDECNKVFNAPLHTKESIKCPYCYPQISTGELNLRELFANKQTIYNSRKIIPPLEVDIFIPELNAAFEYNGSYWHSTAQDRIDKNYHKNKTEKCLKKGIKLYHVWEHDNEEIIKSLIKTKLNLVENKYYARKLILKEINSKDRKEFFNKNHLHGDVNSLFALGLYNENELISCISFRKHKEGIEIARFATKLNSCCVGGFSKLLKHSIIKLKQLNYNKIITYCDRDWTPDYKDSVYFKNGFNFVCDSGSMLKYFNIKDSSLHSREKFQKHKLKEMFPDIYDEKLTANEILRIKGIYIVYNSGNWKFELRF